jgi:hypothetical protein
MSQWYSLETHEVIRQQDTDAVQGLSMDEAARRLIQHGPNELVERGVKSPWRIAWEQLTTIMMIILIVAAAGLGLIAWGRLLHFLTGGGSRTASAPILPRSMRQSGELRGSIDIVHSCGSQTRSKRVAAEQIQKWRHHRLQLAGYSIAHYHTVFPRQTEAEIVVIALAAL